MTSACLQSPDDVVAQYNKLIWKQVWRCVPRLPKHTTLLPDDLYQEGVAQALKAFQTYQRTNAEVSTASQAFQAGLPTGKRRACFTTYVQAALMNRFGRIVQYEWTHWGRLINPHVEIEDEEGYGPVERRRVRLGERSGTFLMA